MTLILDAAPLVALADPDDPQRETLLETLRSEPGSLILPAPIAAEVDYLLGQRFGSSARRAFIDDLAARRYDVVCVEPEEYATVAGLDARYADLDLGLADCSIVVLAALRDRSPSELRRTPLPYRRPPSGRGVQTAAR